MNTYNELIDDVSLWHEELNKIIPTSTNKELSAMLRDDTIIKITTRDKVLREALARILLLS